MGASVAESAVQVAAQTGRLDLVTAILAVLAILLALGAFPLFLYAKWRAETTAREAAQEALKGATDRIEQLAIERLERDLPTLVMEYSRLAQNAATAEVANSIASAQEGGVDQP